MNVSVVICAYTLERWELINAAVSSCADQTLVPHEILLVIDHNDALLARATAEIKGVRVIANRSTKGLSGARNTGVAESTGDVIAFLDDDARADPDWLAALCAPLKDDDVAGVGGWIVPEFMGREAKWFPHTYYWILGCSYEGLPETGATLRNPIGANMVLRREVFDEVGGFTSGIGRIGKVPLGCEETELCIRYTSSHPEERFVLTHEAVLLVEVLGGGTLEGRRLLARRLEGRSLVGAPAPPARDAARGRTIAARAAAPSAWRVVPDRAHRRRRRDRRGRTAPRSRGGAPPAARTGW
jgi:glycosyltransferase involved in cell wall biosynthesis